MEPEGLLPYSQEPASGLYLELVEYCPRPISLRYILILSSHLRPVLPNSMSHPGFSTNILVRIYHLPHVCYLPKPYHPPWFDHSKTFGIMCYEMKFELS
jgi:hypothetical protein